MQVPNSVGYILGYMSIFALFHQQVIPHPSTIFLSSPPSRSIRRKRKLSSKDKTRMSEQENEFFDCHNTGVAEMAKRNAGVRSEQGGQNEGGTKKT